MITSKPDMNTANTLTERKQFTNIKQAKKYYQIHKSQCSNITNMKNKDNIPSAKITNPILMASSESELDKITEREFKKNIMSVFLKIQRI